MKGFIVFLTVVALCMAEPVQLVADDQAEAVDFITGFLEGIHETQTIDNLLKCAKGFEPIIAKVKVAFEYFLNFDLNEILKGVQLLIEAAKEFEEALKPCMEGFETLKKLLAAISSADPMKIAWKIITSPLPIVNDVKAFIAALKSKDYKTAGKSFGDLLYRVFLANSVTAGEPIIDFVTGFLVGINEKRTIDDLLKCMKNADQILDKMLKALKLIVKINFNDLTKGLSMLFESLLELEIMLKPCLSEFTQFQKLIEEIASADIRTLVLKIIRNPNPYLNDFNMCLKAFNEQNYTAAGKYLGDIMYRLFLVEMEIVTEDQAAALDFLKAFLEAINEKGDVNELLKCVSNLETIFKKIMEALPYFKTKNPLQIIRGLTILFEAVTSLLKAIEPCAGSFTQLKKLMEQLKNLNLQKIMGRILMNFAVYFADIQNCIKGFKEKDYALAGKSLGDLLFRLFLADAAIEDEISVEEIIAILSGLLDGINQGGNFNNLEECIDEVPDIINDVKNIIKEMKSLDWKDLEKVVKAILNIVDAFREILANIIPCSKTPSEFEYLIKKFKSVTIMGLINKLLHNTMQIINSISAAISKLSSKDYLGFGNKVGNVIYLTVIQE